MNIAINATVNLWDGYLKKMFTRVVYTKWSIFIKLKRLTNFPIQMAKIFIMRSFSAYKL